MGHKSPWIGSIPALAGERSSRHGVFLQGGVYPRACGGTYPEIPQTAVRLGLSPRLRGNVEGPFSVLCRSGSIPALAGERVGRE